MSVLTLGWSHNPLDSVSTTATSRPRREKGLLSRPTFCDRPYDQPCLHFRAGTRVVCRVRLQMRACDEKDRVSPLFEKFYDIRLPEIASQEMVTIQLTNKCGGATTAWLLG